MSKVECIYPVDDEADDEDGEYRYPPEGFEEWKTSEYCTHEHCAEAAMYLGQWRAESGYRESVAIARQDIDSDETGPDLTDEEMAQVQWRLK